jgi:outer membrane protein assembly factor BamB
LWEIDLGSVLFSSPYSLSRGGGYRDGIVAATTAGDVYLIGCVCNSHVNDDKILCDLEVSDNRVKMDGIVVDKIKLDGEIYSSPVVYGNVLYVGCRDDNIHAIKINNSRERKEKKYISRA